MALQRSQDLITTRWRVVLSIRLLVTFLFFLPLSAPRVAKPWYRVPCAKEPDLEQGHSDCRNPAYTQISPESNAVGRSARGHFGWPRRRRLFRNCLRGKTRRHLPLYRRRFARNSRRRATEDRQPHCLD